MKTFSAGVARSREWSREVSREWSREISRELSREWTREFSPERDRRDASALLACIVGVSLVVASLVFVVLVRMGDIQAGYELYALQKRKVELTQQRSALLLELSALKRPDRLARVGADLGLVPPRADQVLRAYEGAEGGSTDDENGGTR